MLPLLLAASLLAQAEAKIAQEPPPKAETPLAYRAIIESARTCASYVVLAGGDAWTTSWGLEQNPKAGEVNPLGHSPEARWGIRTITTATACLADYEFRRRGMFGWANGTRWGVWALGVGLIVNNLAVGAQGR